MPEPTDYCLINKLGLSSLGYAFGIQSGILTASFLAISGGQVAEYLNDYFQICGESAEQFDFSANEMMSSAVIAEIEEKIRNFKATNETEERQLQHMKTVVNLYFQEMARQAMAKVEEYQP